MPSTPIRYDDRNLRLFKCAINPDLDTRTILVEDQWDYVEMWLKRNNLQPALFFWRQAEAFAKASRDLPNTSSPLTKYYSAMNAAKALLQTKGIVSAPYHGIKGSSGPGPASLANESVRVMKRGTLAALCQYMGESTNNEVYSLEDILYNLAYIHRAYTVTFPARPELFVPIADPLFVRVDNTSQSYFRYKVVDRIYQTPQILAMLTGQERDTGIPNEYIVRLRKRFTWRDGDPLPANVARFKNYYQGVRRLTCYIKGPSRLWYVKITAPQTPCIARSSLTLTFMGLHRLSELARYTPDVLANHFDSQHNWLLSEFINLSLPQFLDEIAAEITGHEFMQPGYSPRG